MKKTFSAALCLALLPQTVWAPAKPWIGFVLALVPLVNIILAILFAIVNRSGKAFFYIPLWHCFGLSYSLFFHHTPTVTFSPGFPSTFPLHTIISIPDYPWIFSKKGQGVEDV